MSHITFLPEPFRILLMGHLQESSVWQVVEENVPQPGARRTEVIRRYQAKYGPFTWRFAWEIDGNAPVPFDTAVTLYEAAYAEHLTRHPEIALYLQQNACDVFDNDPQNVQSGFCYDIQSRRVTHLQDIAIRRVMKVLGYQFLGDELIKVRKSRNRNAVGRSLSPKMVPFHRPEIVRARSAEPPTIEDFWQNNRVLQFSPQLAELPVRDRLSFIRPARTVRDEL